MVHICLLQGPLPLTALQVQHQPHPLSFICTKASDVRYTGDTCCSGGRAASRPCHMAACLGDKAELQASLTGLRGQCGGA
eukprot:CAMPEP_0119102368 /NCGR_PEP_ID=MMETSP1180-20130426/1144_1 /TAXON_ID=3052 ORGANISM="Chlamydomonas cf sp, Strain CCMP681" /NCGR_SAMPLE_ID=MMETSP1180 /ASSEMBLY_ACC=CAM_ASM_000741 /LENGTH=79 /DNA_ID=CAMNT_0007086647 /DNA_START=1147 /DNA_END=1386 /DNA_ORIENTATION=+